MFDLGLKWILDSFVDNNIVRQFVAFTIVIILILILISFIQNIFSFLFKRKKATFVISQTDAEMAYKELGPVPNGATVYVFNIHTGLLERTTKFRFLSRREIDYYTFKQIPAFSQEHAEALFKHWKKYRYEGSH